jgi:hypothetical protein
MNKGLGGGPTDHILSRVSIGKPPELENGSRVVVPRYLAVIMIPVTVPA